MENRATKFAGDAAVLRGQSGQALQGTTRAPGDKSISHRALMFGASAVGETIVHGLLEAEDVLATADALRQLGADIQRDESGVEPIWRVWGRGVGGFSAPDDVLDLGNSGTGARLLMGLTATHDMSAIFTGDRSLRGRPMERIMAPLRRMGASFEARPGGRLPIHLRGAVDPIPITETLSVASAQLKSAILLAGLNTPGTTTVIEPSPSRDHTERMLRAFGAEVTVSPAEDGIGNVIALQGQPELTATTITVPSDISSAAFPLVAALISPDSTVTLQDVGLNPLRAGLLQSLQEMGANITIAADRKVGGGGEPIGDVTASTSALVGVTVPAERAPRMIDEYPILAMAAACANGTTVFEGIGELRVKESDRLHAIAAGLSACGVTVEEDEDRLTIIGNGAAPTGGATVETQLDHRIAMAFLVLGLASDAPIAVDDAAPIATSFPEFLPLMRELGADIDRVA